MIIHSLRAANFLKYSRLKLDDLPAAGVIAVSGANESGKSTIGETLCFALFGRSFAVDVDELDKLIRWGETRCAVELEFSGRDGERYRIVRMLDCDGNHSARLSRADQPDEPIARGVVAVSDAMYNKLGYAYSEFVESFYLAQREITTPHPHSDAVKIMAGLAPLEYCRAEFADDLEREQEGVDTAEARAEAVMAQVAELAFDESLLRGLEEQHRQLKNQENAVTERADALARVVDRFQEEEPQLRKAESSRGTASGLRFLFLLLALAGLGLWALLALATHLPASQQLAELFSANLSFWDAQGPNWLLFGGIGGVVLFLALWMRTASLNSRIEELRDSGLDLKRELGLLDEMASGLPDRAMPDDDSVTRLDPEVREPLIRHLEDGTASAREAASAVERESAWLEAVRETLSNQLREAEQALNEQRDVQREHNKLLGMQSAFEQQAADHNHRILLREIADEMLLGASRHLSLRFNRNLRSQVGKTLPLFTDGRYEHLQIDDDLTVRAFSSKKRDFMGLDEISSGTQRQIMLAVRLALAQELVNRMVQSAQFVFLDEPFAFFDEARTRSALKVLPRLSDDLEQVWIVAQEFPEGEDFARHIQCSRNAESIISTEAGTEHDA